MVKFISSLRVRVSIIILFTILSFLAIFYYINLEERKSEIVRMKRETLEFAEIISIQEKDFLDNTRRLLLAVSEFDEIRNYNSDQCDQTLSALLPHLSQYNNFGVANTEGDVICSALPLNERVNIADRKYFLEAFVTQDIAIGDYQVGQITHKPTINLGYPIYGYDGQLTGVVFAAVDLNQFSKFEEKIASKIPEHAILTKIDESGIVLVRVPGGENLIGSQAPETSIVAEALKQDEGLVEAIGMDGSAWIYAFVTIKSNIYQDDIHLILGQSEENMFAETNRIFNRSLLIMAIAGTLLVFVAWYVSDLSFMRQIESLLNATQKLTKGDLTARYSKVPYGTSEINAVGIAFNQMAISLEKRELDLLDAYDTTIAGWSRALDLRDNETEGHTERVTEMTLELARAAGIPGGELAHIKRGALLHDIGKIGIADSILLKPGKLTDEEWVIMRKHPTFAFELLSPIEYLRPAVDIPYCHHEKWDGSGYPRGLTGETIPFTARLFAVIDVWDALLSDRPYRLGWPKEKVISHIKSLSGTHFDPKAVELFLNLINKNKTYIG